MYPQQGGIGLPGGLGGQGGGQPVHIIQGGGGFAMAPQMIIEGLPPGVQIANLSGMDLQSLQAMMGGAIPVMAAPAPMGAPQLQMAPPPMGVPPPMQGGQGGQGSQGLGDPSNKFFKTRMCQKWQEGKCNYGPGCRYAHGDGDLRPSVGGDRGDRGGGHGSGGSMGPMGGGMAPMGGPPMGGPPGISGPAPPPGGPPPRPMRGQASGTGKIMTPSGSAPAPMIVGALGAAPGGGGGGGGGGMGPMGGGGGPPGLGGGGGGGRDGGPRNPQIHKTQLCERFMETGACQYGQKCTYAHGQEQLRAAPPGADVNGGFGGGPNGGGGGGTTRGTRGGQNKRQRSEQGQPGPGPRPPVVPPEHEVMPREGAGMDLQAIRQRFEAIKNELNAFAADTGHSVAVFTIGGILSDAPDTPAEDFAADCIVKASPAAAHPRLKLSVLKHGTGGVAHQLVSRQEIVKFVCARGTKALAEIAEQERQQ